MANEHIIGGVAGLALAWFLFRKSPMQTKAEQIKTYEAMAANGAIPHTALPVIVDMIAQGATPTQVQAYVSSATGPTNARIWMPSIVTPAPVFIPDMPGAAPALTWEPECMNDLDCQKIYGPGWVCIQGRCVKLYEETEDPLGPEDPIDATFPGADQDATFLGGPPF